MWSLNEHYNPQRVVMMWSLFNITVHKGSAVDQDAVTDGKPRKYS